MQERTKSAYVVFAIATALIVPAAIALRTVIHPASPVASALLALSEYRPISGKDFVNALVLGVEVECRIGNAVYPSHYDAGWHITGTVGPFGAAAAVGEFVEPYLDNSSSTSVIPS